MLKIIERFLELKPHVLCFIVFILFSIAGYMVAGFLLVLIVLGIGILLSSVVKAISEL